MRSLGARRGLDLARHVLLRRLVASNVIIYMTNKSCFSTSCLGPLFHDNLFGGFDRDLNPARMWGAENPRPKAVRQSSTSRKTGIREGYITAFERYYLESIGIQINFCLHSLRSIDIPCMSISVTTASMQSYLPSQQPLIIFPIQSNVAVSGNVPFSYNVLI